MSMAPLTCPHCGGVAMLRAEGVDVYEPPNKADYRHVDGRPMDGGQPPTCDACGKALTFRELGYKPSGERPAPDPRVRTPDRRVRGPVGDREVRPQ